MEKAELMKMVQEEDYSKKKLLEEIDRVILSNEKVQAFIKEYDSQAYCFDLMVSHSQSRQVLAFIISLLDQGLNQVGDSLAIFTSESYQAVELDIDLETIEDLEALITKTYILSK